MELHGSAGIRKGIMVRRVARSKEPASRRREGNTSKLVPKLVHFITQGRWVNPAMDAVVVICSEKHLASTTLFRSASTGIHHRLSSTSAGEASPVLLSLLLERIVPARHPAFHGITEMCCLRSRGCAWVVSVWYDDDTPPVHGSFNTYVVSPC